MAEAPSRWRDYTLRQKSTAQIAWVALYATVLAPESPQPMQFPWSDLAGGVDGICPSGLYALKKCDRMLGAVEICLQGSALRRSVALALEKNAAALDLLADVGWRHDPYAPPLHTLILCNILSSYRSLGIPPPTPASILHAMRAVIQISRLSPDAAAALCRWVASNACAVRDDDDNDCNSYEANRVHFPMFQEVSSRRRHRCRPRCQRRNAPSHVAPCCLSCTVERHARRLSQGSRQCFGARWRVCCGGD